MLSWAGLCATRRSESHMAAVQRSRVAAGDRCSPLRRVCVCVPPFRPQECPGSTIVTDSVTSNGLTSFIEANGGKHFRWGTSRAALFVAWPGVGQKGALAADSDAGASAAAKRPRRPSLWLLQQHPLCLQVQARLQECYQQGHAAQPGGGCVCWHAVRVGCAWMCSGCNQGSVSC